jgi:hypothetical protein
VYEKAKKPGDKGASSSGQTLLRATGLIPPTKISHAFSTAPYPRLNSLKVSSENGSGERSSQAQKAPGGRPRDAKCDASRPNLSYIDTN